MIEVYMSYDVKGSGTVLCACLVKEGVLLEKIIEVRDVVPQYEQAMRSFCLASKLLKDHCNDTGFYDLVVVYKGTDQYVDTWLLKGKKEYQNYINFILRQNDLAFISSWSYEKLKGGRDALKNNIAKKYAVKYNRGSDSTVIEKSNVIAFKGNLDVKEEGLDFTDYLDNKSENSDNYNVNPFKSIVFTELK